MRWLYETAVMAIVVLLTLKPVDGRIGAVGEAMQKTLPDTRAYAGCLGVWACMDVGKNEILVYERWLDLESQQAYMGWRRERGDIDRMMPLLAAPPLFETREDLFG